jgi:hypothetical protein
MSDVDGGPQSDVDGGPQPAVNIERQNGGPKPAFSIERQNDNEIETTPEVTSIKDLQPTSGSSSISAPKATRNRKPPQVFMKADQVDYVTPKNYALQILNPPEPLQVLVNHFNLKDDVDFLNADFQRLINPYITSSSAIQGSTNVQDTTSSAPINRNKTVTTSDTTITALTIQQFLLFAHSHQLYELINPPEFTSKINPTIPTKTHPDVTTALQAPFTNSPHDEILAQHNITAPALVPTDSYPNSLIEPEVRTPVATVTQIRPPHMFDLPYPFLETNSCQYPATDTLTVTATNPRVTYDKFHISSNANSDPTRLQVMVAQVSQLDPN